jgi:hypothetical protein
VCTERSAVQVSGTPPRIDASHRRLVSSIWLMAVYCPPVIPCGHDLAARKGLLEDGVLPCIATAARRKCWCVSTETA